MDGWSGLVGLARRARKAVVGTAGVESAVRRGRARLVLLAGDAGGDARRRVQAACRERSVPVVAVADKETLGAAVGMTSLAVLAIVDESLAGAIWKALAAAGRIPDAATEASRAGGRIQE